MIIRTRNKSVYHFLQFLSVKNNILAKALSLFFLLATSSEMLIAQSILPVIKANSNSIKILDGDDLQEGSLVPELKPDIYTYHKTNETKRISFYTDIDTFSVLIKPGDICDFIVLLRDKDSCFQRFSYLNPRQVKYASPGSSISDTIPFVLGANNAIHIQGKINGSSMLDLIFDTGASIGVLSDQGKEKKAFLNKDYKNRLEFAGIAIDNSPAIYVDYKGALKADGVIGYNAFEDKIVQIDYDKHIMVVNSSLPGSKTQSTKLNMVWRGSSMFIEGMLQTRSKKCKGLFLFDTGSKWALSLTKDFSSQNQLYDEMTKVGSRTASGVNGKSIKSNTVTLPILSLGDINLPNVPIDLELLRQDDGLAFNILGNDVLKRFNVILDYQHGLVYLKANSLLHSPYNKSFDKWLWVLVAMIFIIVTGLIFYRRRNK